LQMKSNCGCFLIDDFGRQRIEPKELLNRWIVPLESRVDYLTLSTGKKIQVPFEQLIIFSTNLEPSDLVDEAFLRRIPYKIHVCDPGPEEYHDLFEIYAREFGCTYRPDVVDYLIEKHYKSTRRPMRRCHPRDLLSQIRSFCAYHDLPVEMRDDYFDRVIKSYFAVVVNTATPGTPTDAQHSPPSNGRLRNRERSITQQLDAGAVLSAAQQERQPKATTKKPGASSDETSDRPKRAVRENTRPPSVTNRPPEKTLVRQPVIEPPNASSTPASQSPRREERRDKTPPPSGNGTVHPDSPKRTNPPRESN
jgi:Mg-chelatase subunit ChlI